MLENITMGYKRGKNGSTHGRDVRLFLVHLGTTLTDVNLVIGY